MNLNENSLGCFYALLLFVVRIQTKRCETLTLYCTIPTFNDPEKVAF